MLPIDGASLGVVSGGTDCAGIPAPGPLPAGALLPSQTGVEGAGGRECPGTRNPRSWVSVRPSRGSALPPGASPEPEGLPFSAGLLSSAGSLGLSLEAASGPVSAAPFGDASSGFQLSASMRSPSLMTSASTTSSAVLGRSGGRARSPSASIHSGARGPSSTGGLFLVSRSLTRSPNDRFPGAGSSPAPVFSEPSDGFSSTISASSGSVPVDALAGGSEGLSGLLAAAVDSSGPAGFPVSLSSLPDSFSSSLATLAVPGSPGSFFSALSFSGPPGSVVLSPDPLAALDSSASLLPDSSLPMRPSCRPRSPTPASPSSRCRSRP